MADKLASEIYREGDDAVRALHYAIEAARVSDSVPLTQALAMVMLEQANQSLKHAADLERTGKLASLVGQMFPVGPRLLRELMMAWLVVHGGKNAQ